MWAKSSLVGITGFSVPNVQVQLLDLSLCRVYLAIATEEDLRGLIVQQGAAKVRYH